MPKKSKKEILKSRIEEIQEVLKNTSDANPEFWKQSDVLRAELRDSIRLLDNLDNDTFLKAWDNFLNEIRPIGNDYWERKFLTSEGRTLTLHKVVCGNKGTKELRFNMAPFESSKGIPSV